MTKRITMHLNDDDWEALRKIAAKEYRDPRQQAGILVHDALVIKGVFVEQENEKLKAKTDGTVAP